MVKPQFEVGKDRVGAGGVVRDPALRAEAVLDVAAAARRPGPRRGRGGGEPAARAVSGNVEFFVWLRRDAPAGRTRSGRVVAAGPHRGRDDRRWSPHDAGRRCWSRTPGGGAAPSTPARSRADLIEAGLRGAGGRRGGRRPRPARCRAAVAGPTPPRASRSSSRSAATARSCARPSWPGRRRRRCSGINLGKVGFLAEAEIDDLDQAVRDVVARDVHSGRTAHPRRRAPSSTASWSPSRGRSTR